MLQDLLMSNNSQNDITATIRNPVPNSEGIFAVDYSDGTSKNIYGMVDSNGDQWLLVSQYTTSGDRRVWEDLVSKDFLINGYSQDSSNYPIIKSGILNKANKARFRSLNPAWISFYGTTHLDFDTFTDKQVIGINGFDANKANGDVVKLFAEAAGFYLEQTIGQRIYLFGIWTQWGPNGPCGGEGRVGPNKICPVIIHPSSGLNNHADYTSYQKHLFLKVN